MATYDPKILYVFLAELGIIGKEVLDRAYTESVQHGKPFDEVLLSEDVISDENLGKAIADIIKTPFVTLSKIAIPDDLLRLIPEVVARKEYVIAYGKDEKGIRVAMYDPDNDQMRQYLAKTTGWPIIPSYATKKDIEDAMGKYATNAVQAFTDILQMAAKKDATGDAPIIAIVDTIIKNGYENKTSDIHIEPYENTSLVRYRIDGILHDIVRLPPPLHDQIVTRVKVMSRMRTDEHQAAQDGKISFVLSQQEKLDIRVSVVPIEEGEKVVMRLLSERSRQYTMTDLGFSESDYDKLQKASKKPYGMILVTGPTGSGKTTTLYAILKQLNNRSINVMTIEDPVEYDILGVNQIQVNTKTNLTFAAGLKSIVRQDPDIILVGEIRDEETAGIAVNSAMTGHLVLSTLHANDAATTLPRLFDFEIEPFLIASTINIIMAQRLVRKICMKCRVSQEVKIEDITPIIPAHLVTKYFTGKNVMRLYKGKGCPVCHGTGYEGRIGIFEVMTMDDSIKVAILEKKDSSVIEKIAVQNGMTTMMEDGLRKIFEGLTTIEEVMRVTKE
jgi:type IV pilus assembly protein PilB